MINAGEIRQALVVNLDVHQGDENALIIEHEPHVFTFSVHGEKNYSVRRGQAI